MMWGRQATAKPDVGSAEVLAASATASYNTGNFKAAVKKATRAAEIYQALDVPYAAAQAHATVGMALIGLGRLGQAADVHGQAADLLGRTDDRAAEAGMRAMQGRSLLSAGRLDEARPVLQAAAALLQEADEEQLALICQAKALTLEKRHEEAIAIGERLVAIREPAGEPLSTANALTELALGLQEAGRFEDAAEAHWRAMLLFREAGNTQLANQAHRAVEDARRGSYPISSLADSSLVDTNLAHQEGTAIFQQGLAALRAKRNAEAAEALQKAVEHFHDIKDPSCECRSQLNLGLALYKCGRVDEARRWFYRAAELARDTYDDEVRADALQALDVSRGKAHRS